MLKYVLEGLTGAAAFLVVQLGLLPAMMMTPPKNEVLAGMTFVIFVMYVTLSVLWRTNEKES